MPKRLRITHKRLTLNAGIVVLIGVLMGGAVYFYSITEGSIGLALGFYSNPHVLTRSDDLAKLLEEENRPVAVMFSSETCPVCRTMEPHWKVLCEKSDLPVSFSILMLNRDTARIFLDYGVVETPTFIVFVDGRPVARHVGGFTGDNITSVMLNWALASSGTTLSVLEDKLELFKTHCSTCHGAPESLDYESIISWIESRSSSDQLAAKLSVSVEYGVPLSEYYGGTQNLARVIYDMGAGIEGEQAYSLALLLDSIAFIGRETTNGTASRLNVESSPLQATFIAIPLLTGLIASVSPCVFPLLVVYASTTVTKRGSLRKLDSIKALAASALGVIAIGALFLIVGGSIGRLTNVLMPVAGLAVLASGILGYMDIPTFINMGISAKRGILGFSFLYGLLAVQCSFPIVAGSLLLIASSEAGMGALSLMAFAIGVSTPVALVVLGGGSPRIKRVLDRISGEAFRRYSYLILAFMGFMLIVYSLSLI